MTTQAKAIWDRSVIGMSQDDKDAMDRDEQVERAEEEINRAADILEAVVDAFSEHFQADEIATLQAAARMAIGVARADR